MDRTTYIDNEQKAAYLKELSEMNIGVNLNVYVLIKDSLNMKLHNSMFDNIRNEICKCLLFGFDQASITLTNHLLEKFLKFELIASEMSTQVMTDMKLYESEYERGLDKYDKLNLSNTIDRSCTKNIITKKQKIQLHEYRELLRNAYGHAETRTIFGDKKIVAGLGSFVNNTPMEVGEIKVANFPAIQGIMQADLAKKEALPYFLYIDRLVVDQTVKRFPDILKYQF